MELTVKVKIAQNAEVLSRFLKSIQYVEEVEIEDDNTGDSVEFTPGNYRPGQKLSDFAGIWNGKKRNAKMLRRKAWSRKIKDYDFIRGIKLYNPKF